MSVNQLRDPASNVALPDLVQRYVECNVSSSGSGRHGVRFTQAGEMQLRPGRWSPFHAKQEIASDRVAFAWHASFRLAPFVRLEVKDWYRADAAGLDARLWGIIRVEHARGPQIERGEAIRYLLELPLAPQAMALNAALQWRAVDASTVEVATLAGGERVIVLLHFDASGDIASASAEARPRMVGKRIVDTPLSGAYSAYRTFDGVRLPTTAEVSWILPDGPFAYFRGAIVDWSAETQTQLHGLQRAGRPESPRPTSSRAAS